MRFDGFDRCRPNGGFHEEADLPPKLAALGEQLSDDARMLERRYPAWTGQALAPFHAAIAEAMRGEPERCEDEADSTWTCQPADRPEKPSTKGAVPPAQLRWSIAVSVFAGAAFVAIVIWQAAFHGQLDNQVAPVAMPAAELLARSGEHSDADTSNAAGSRRPRATAVSAVPDADASDAAEFRPVGNLLKGLSSAEQEAVLDLFEGGAERSASLSI